MRLSYCLPLLFAVLVCGCSTPTAPTDDPLRTLKIYHTNDIHAHLSPNGEQRGGLAYLASVLKIIRKQDNNAIILDAGDFYKKGSLPCQNTKDEVAADILHQMPAYDARAVGNNEIKVGISKLLEWSKTKETAPLLSANFVDKDKKPVFEPYVILKKGDLTVGIIGATPLVPIEADVQADPKSDPRAPYAILDPLGAVLPYVQSLRPQVDVLILLSHNHFKENKKFADEHPEIDLVVSGHSHVLTGEQKTLHGNLTVEAGQFGQQMGLVTLVYDRQKKKTASLESVFWPVGEEYQIADGPTAIAIRQAYAKWAPDAFIRYGRAVEALTVVDFTNPYEGTLADWVVDQFQSVMKADLALVNREMLRETIYKGWITKEAIAMGAPYPDHVAVVRVKAQKFRNALEKGAVKSLQKAGLFPWALKNAQAHITFSDHQFKNASVQLTTHKDAVTVALPAYMTTHCLEFFEKDFCPLKVISTGPEVRTLIEEHITAEKQINPPPLDRVVVQDYQANPDGVSTDAEDENEPNLTE